MVALDTFWYSFVEMHKRHQVSPAMAAGILDRLRGKKDGASRVEASAPRPGKRGPYTSRTQAKVFVVLA